MKCPIDSADLVISERSGIEIDYCPKCRGVWLDRGELDKIIEKNATTAPAMPAYSPEPEYRRPEQKRYEDHDEYYQKSHKKHKKENFLGDLFDF